jgi:hypothetical protein
VIKTVEISWDEFRKRYALLLDRIMPALRSIDEDSIALRTEDWSILPRWDDQAFYFEVYGDEPTEYNAADDDTQMLVTGVPFGKI